MKFQFRRWSREQASPHLPFAGLVIGLLQRLTQARVEVAGETLGAVGEVLLALIGIADLPLLHNDRDFYRESGDRAQTDPCRSKEKSR